MKLLPLALCVGATFATALAAAASRPTPLPLRVQPATKAAAQPAAQLQARHDRFIVQYRTGAAASRTTATASSHVGTALSRAGLKAAGAKAVSMRAVRRTSQGSHVLAASRPLDRAEAERFLAQLQADPQVAWAQPDYIKHALDTVPGDPRYADLQWDMHHRVGGVRAPRAWDVGNGRDMVVAVIDTGYVKHADLSANLLPGYDFISAHGQLQDGTRHPDVAGDGNGRDADARDPGDWTDDSMDGWCGLRSPSSWHGTHVAGTVAAVANNGIGIAGLAHGAKVQPVRALGHCGGTTSDIVDAITWASGGSVEGVPANRTPADVINLSLGSAVACTRDPATQAAIDGALARGVVVVAAAGNANIDASQFSPASCNGVITVGATDVAGARAGYSNYGPAVALAAPGGGGMGPQETAFIWSTGNSGTTTPVASPRGDVLLGMVGTSMAAPHVAAAAAMLQGASVANGHPPLTPGQVRAILKGTARPFGVAPPANQAIGTGILDAAAAIAAAANGYDERAAALPLTSRVPATGIGGLAYEDGVYKLTVGSGVRSLQLRSYGGTGNVALYLARGRMPTPDSYDRASNNAGNAETITLASPAAGTYYIRLRSPTVYRNVSLLAVAQ
jgi:serine protease